MRRGIGKERELSGFFERITPSAFVPWSRCSIRPWFLQIWSLYTRTSTARFASSTQTMSCWRRFNMPFRLSSAHPTEERQSELIASSPFHGRQKSLFPCRWNVGESSLRGEHEYPLSVAWNGNDVGNPHSGTCDSERFGWSVGFAGPSSKRSEWVFWNFLRRQRRIASSSER